ncbi:hypothetical protein T261_4336 [Streptomyces lydicus]|nr:hypothetical protein T261_4336 [Streptomyces lydicus]
MRINEYVAAVLRGARPHGGFRGRPRGRLGCPGARCARKRSRRLPLALVYGHWASVHTHRDRLNAARQGATWRPGFVPASEPDR